MKNTYILLGLALFFGYSGYSIPTNNSINNPGPGTPAQAVSAVPGASLHFDGVNDVVSIGNSITTGLNTKNQITVEAWVYPTANSGNGAIVGNYAYPANNGEQQFLLRRDDDNQYAFFVDDSKGYKGVFSGLNTLLINTWQHVVGTWDGSVISLYVDGVLKDTTQKVTGPHFFTTSNSVAIGGNDAGRFFQGNIDEVRIWSRALCVSEITADKNCEVRNNAPGLLGNYHFNQGVDNTNNATILTLNDSSGINNHGTLLNFGLTGLTSNWSLKAGVVSGTSCTPYNGISSVTIASQTDVSCNGKSDGSVALSVNGISPSFLWAPTGGTAATATGLAAGTYTCTITSACTGTRTQIVTIKQPPAIGSTQNLSLCSGQSVTVGTSTYTVTGNYTDVLKAKNNCDSTVTTNLFVAPLLIYTQNITLCAGQSITVGKNTYTTSGNYKDTVTSKIYSCDSTITTNLLVNPAIVSTQNITLCAGQSITIGKHTYNTSGTYKDTLIAKNFCDSTVTTNLLVHPPNVYTQNITLCAGQSIMVGTNTYNATGNYTDVLKGKNNCDSTVTTHLVVNPAIVYTQNITLCAGQSITIGKHTYTTSGTYKDTVIAKNFCDSTVTTNLVVNPAIVYSQNITLCAGQSITIGKHTYTTSGTYKDTVIAKNFCDSTVTTNLTVENAIDVAITTVGNTITATATGATYQWFECLGAALPNETNQSFTATTNGNYAVKITVGSCSDTSSCQQIIVTGIRDADANHPAELYPNPSNGLINLVVNSSQQVFIINAIGQVVYNNVLSAGKHLIDLQQQPAGLYTVQLIGNNSTQHFKLIKE